MSSVSKPRVRQNRHKQGLNQTLEKISADFRKEGNTYDGVYFEIAKDINLGTNGIVRIWVPIGLDTEHAFKGTIKNGSNTQGNPYVISGMTIRANGIGTTKNFGLFGVLHGKVEGLVIKNAKITVNTDDDFAIGTLCGEFGTSKNGKRLGSVSRCTVEGTNITTSSSSSPYLATIHKFIPEQPKNSGINSFIDG